MVGLHRHATQMAVDSWPREVPTIRQEKARQRTFAKQALSAQATRGLTFCSKTRPMYILPSTTATARMSRMQPSTVSKLGTILYKMNSRTLIGTAVRAISLGDGEEELEPTSWWKLREAASQVACTT